MQTSKEIAEQGEKWIAANPKAWAYLVSRAKSAKLYKPGKPVRINAYVEELRGMGASVPNAIRAYLSRKLEHETGAEFTKAQSKVTPIVEELYESEEQC